ncbi:OLC1v1007630C1 [Oldenlandia corymbosa var. corymbosa]|uniref:non-specific serine/threonine protein kinase n=1 Tax=Oldenlandia corymbosa var. corymbosa TaxID=529605 RepID=A0AAV1DMW1_OLDCO|nr:OLC1v1007630C1 [Oldenlandia corymbosa var. corymbosa]
MKCFHFSNGDGEEEEDGDEKYDAVSSHHCSRTSSRVSWARSLSVASSRADSVVSSRPEYDDFFTDSSVEFQEFLSQRRRRLGNDLRVFSFGELKAATRGFSRVLLIGEGGFGCVYRGAVLLPGPGQSSTVEVAIKQLNRNGYQGHKEWINEVNFLGVVNHPNLVKLIGYCAEDDERGIQRLLVYELMHNKSLEDHLLARSSSSPPLSWMQRLKIAQDAARGLAYLHEEMDFQLIFRDFKASNILLDENFKAKLSDFGLARQGPAAGLGHVSTTVVGTVGYAAPEYVHTGKLTAKSDVWSFGVVLYELITGRRVLERNLPRAEQKLLEWVKPFVSDSKKFHFIMDPRLRRQQNCTKSAQKLASLANKCLMKHPKARPKMSEVVEMLEHIICDAYTAPDCILEKPVNSTKNVEESFEGMDVAQESAAKLGGSSRRGFDIRKEMVNFRNKSIGRLDWRNWTPGLVRSS